MVRQGDIISLPCQEASRQVGVLHALYGSVATAPDGNAVARSLVHFRVRELRPAAAGALAVDISRTAVALQVWITWWQVPFAL